MKTISKALIAVMAAAAMCLVPLFAVADDSDAATLTAGDKAVSFEAGEISDEKFNGLVTQEYKDYLAGQSFNAIFPSSGDWSLVDHATVKNIKNVKLSLGNSVSDSEVSNVTASAITFDVVMTAKCTRATTMLFALKDGTQTLYKELGTYVVILNDQVTIEGTVTIEDYDYEHYSIVKNSANDYVTKEITSKGSKSASFDGKVKINALDKTYELKAKTEMGGESTVKPSYYNAEKIEDVTKTSKVILDYDIGSTTVSSEFNYKIGDKSDGYSVKYDAMELIGVEFDYMPGTVETLSTPATILYFEGTIAPTDVYYYKADGDIMGDSFFVDGTVSITDPTNEKVKNYLADIGTVSDEYSAAKSVADGAYTPVSADGSSGGNNIVFYIIIGVLAVAVVALAVLMIKKK